MIRALPVLALLAAPALAEVPRVVADTPVTHSLAAQVMLGLGTPDLLLDPGADPHHAALRPTQAQALARAGLVIWTGPGLTPWLSGPIEALATGALLDLGAANGLHRQEFRDAALLDDHTDTDHDHDHDHADDTDPHLWLDPANAALWVETIAAQLALLDPDNADRYAANAGHASADIAALSADLAQTLASAGGTGLVMFHDAYGYFATAFGLNILGTITRGDAAAPGAARLTALRTALAGSRGGSATICLFPEANHPQDLVALIAEGTDLRIGAPLDPAGVMQTPGPTLYAQTLRALARAIADCAAGS